MSDIKEVIINDVAMEQVIIPMIESFIAALDSDKSKTAIKRQVKELLASAQAASHKMAADKLAASLGGSHSASHYQPKSHIHIVV